MNKIPKSVEGPTDSVMVLRHFDKLRAQQPDITKQE